MRAFLLFVVLALAACDTEPLPVLAGERALGAGELGPLAFRVMPERRRVRATAGQPLHLLLDATDAQGDLSGADFYLDGALVGQQHVGDVGGSGASARFELGLTVAAGTHEIVAKAFDRQSRYSEGVTWNVTALARRRALYVSHLADGSPGQLLGHPAAVADLLAYVVAHGIDGIVFYQVHADLDGVARTQLAELLQTLRAAGVVELGAAVGPTQLAVVEAFNHEHPDAAFDLIALEKEYWLDCDTPAHGYSHECAACRAACFPPYLAFAQAARALADREAAAGRPLTVAAYLGYPSVDEAEAISALVDRVLLNYTGASPLAAYDRAYAKWGQVRARLQAFAGSGRTVEVWPILYACGEANMGPWLAEHGLAAAEDAFLARLHGETAVFVRDLVVRGFVYFRYGGPDGDGCL